MLEINIFLICKTIGISMSFNHLIITFLRKLVERDLIKNLFCFSGRKH
ncbi:hypothetical protein A1OE_1473 [Candidatus Endolissoclinum faulkneri L2]|uniref:Uncharacterized protein n=1 Tax=Candidatus Endolissoclinum faulkneri L2 TaxID=1193729 RepID=K7YQ10_9PROT|nr:hypothetical protein A1OE_1473 [Candidatus Endolissoclinum faulkneri L2]